MYKPRAFTVCTLDYVLWSCTVHTLENQGEKKRMDEWMNEWTNGEWTNEWMNECNWTTVQADKVTFYPSDSFPGI